MNLTKAKCLLASIISAATLLGSANNARSQGDVSPISFSFPVERTLREPVLVDVTLANTLAERISVDLGDNRKGAFRFRITRPDGSQVAGPPPATGLIFPGRLVLNPGQRSHLRLVLNQWCDFSQVGRYVIEVDLLNPVITAEGEPVLCNRRMRSALTVLPRDPARLKATCETLVQQIIAAPSTADAADLALALSYVNDQIAVPYLEHLLESRARMGQFAVEGLRRIGGPESVRALILAYKTGEEDTAEMARSALLGLRATTSDTKVRREIDRALARNR